jgi:hypothetical protein
MFSRAPTSLVLVAMVTAGGASCEWVQQEDLAHQLEHRARPPGAPPPVGRDAGGSGQCHDLAPASGVVEVHHFPDSCPLTAPPRGGQLDDGTYVEVARQICRTHESAATSGIPVRVRVSGHGTKLDWTSDTPVFSAVIANDGQELLVTETCRWGGPGQPPYTRPFTVVGDDLTLYDGLSVMVLRRELP